MNVLRLNDSGDEDSIRLTFESSFDQQVARESELALLFQSLEQYAGEWMPDVVGGKRRRKYSRANLWNALEERRGERSTDVWLHRTKWPALDMWLHLRLPPLPSKLGLTISVKPLSFFTEEKRCHALVEMVRAWASRYPVSYASAHSADDRELAGSPYFGRDQQTAMRDGFDKVYELFWLNVFGPKWVETVGRERMLSTPAHRVEELPNGAILLLLRPTVADFASEESRLVQARAHVHLRPDLDFDTVLRTLRERSARLVPVEPCFHPDVAPFLSRVVDHTASHERPRQVAEFNAYRPPEPEEWRPAHDALPPDVDDPERAREHYAALAERLVALLHTRVPSVFEGTPESLSDVDYQLWHEDFSRVFEREHIDAHAVPALGAYLGQVLVEHLGGQWIPRQKLEEAQVLVGQRVWFPFVRAHHCMRSLQAQLDQSLTQFYLVAERYRR